MELIIKHFSDLNEKQIKQLTALGPLYSEWNEKINVISRKDIEHLYKHHILHSMILAKYFSFKPGSAILDVGTGGGLPGIPLAILFPEVQFTLLDSTAKKILVVNEIAKAIGLENITGVHSRVEDHKGNYDLIISRAVTTLTQMVAWTKHLVPDQHWIIFKGGIPSEIRKELPPKYKVISTPVTNYIKDDYFKDKYLVEVNKA
jgi:16S rRNA (guanine527-N7)-methyltransferase